MNLSDFQSILDKTDKPILVDFWAPWCAPCRLTKPILDTLAQEYRDSVEFIPINTDESPEVAQRFRILGIPTLLALRQGEVVARLTGARNEAAYRELFDALAQGKQVQARLAPFDRLLRLGVGASLLVIAYTSGSWLAALAGGLLAFSGVYDRCPVWRALTSLLQKRASTQMD